MNGNLASLVLAPGLALGALAACAPARPAEAPLAHEELPSPPVAAAATDPVPVASSPGRCTSAPPATGASWLFTTERTVHAKGDDGDFDDSETTTRREEIADPDTLEVTQLARRPGEKDETFFVSVKDGRALLMADENHRPLALTSGAAIAHDYRWLVALPGRSLSPGDSVPALVEAIARSVFPAARPEDAQTGTATFASRGDPLPWFATFDLALQLTGTGAGMGSTYTERAALKGTVVLEDRGAPPYRLVSLSLSGPYTREHRRLNDPSIPARTSTGRLQVRAERSCW